MVDSKVIKSPIINLTEQNPTCKIISIFPIIFQNLFHYDKYFSLHHRLKLGRLG